jgi:hypothetical protein
MISLLGFFRARHCLIVASACTSKVSPNFLIYHIVVRSLGWFGGIETVSNVSHDKFNDETESTLVDDWDEGLVVEPVESRSIGREGSELKEVFPIHLVSVFFVRVGHIRLCGW